MCTTRSRWPADGLTSSEIVASPLRPHVGQLITKAICHQGPYVQYRPVVRFEPVLILFTVSYICAFPSWMSFLPIELLNISAAASFFFLPPDVAFEIDQNGLAKH